MPGLVSNIFRHPIKSHSREAIEHARVDIGGTLPWDRVWGVAHSETRVDGRTWASCQNFSRGSKAAELAAIKSDLDEKMGIVTLRHPSLGTLRFDPDSEGEKLIAWTQALMPSNRAQSARVIRAATQSFTDSDFPSITIGNLVSHRAVEQRLRQTLSLHRWRANIWCEGLAPWEEFDWIDREVQIGSAILIPRERTDRCLATHNNPDTGKRDVNILAALESWGHTDFTVRAEVVKAGAFSVGDKVVPL